LPKASPFLLKQKRVPLLATGDAGRYIHSNEPVSLNRLMYV
jgi:hypothetical protein